MFVIKRDDEYYEKAIRIAHLSDSLFNTVLDSVQIKQYRDDCAGPKVFDEYLKQKKAKEAQKNGKTKNS